MNAVSKFSYFIFAFTVIITGPNLNFAQNELTVEYSEPKLFKKTFENGETLIVIGF